MLPLRQKNKKQSSISDLFMLKKGKNEINNNNKEHEGHDDNGKTPSITAVSNTQPPQR